MTRAYDPDDPDQAAERQQSAERRRQQDDADWRWIASTPQGRRVLFEVLSVSGFMQPSFDENPLVMAQREGKRAIGQHVYTRITMIADGADRAALLAEVTNPPDVWNRSTIRPTPGRRPGD